MRHANPSEALLSEQCLAAVCMLYGANAMATEEPKFEVIAQLEHIEQRRYTRNWRATTRRGRCPCFVATKSCWKLKHHR